jgi:2-hydroxychromene-2-carboxylate isomerase
MDAPTIDFWVSIGSTYSYLSVMRIEEIAKTNSIKFRWRPFSVRSIMVEQNNIPFRGKPVKMNYMWRDIERRAQKYNLSARLPAPYPLLEFDLANKVAIVGEDKDWCKAYIQATYRRWFQNGEEAGSEPNLSDSLREVGQRPDKDRNVYICPANKILTTTGKLVSDGETLLYRTKARDCRGCLLKAQCCPKTSVRKTEPPQAGQVGRPAAAIRLFVRCVSVASASKVERKPPAQFSG